MKLSTILVTVTTGIVPLMPAFATDIAPSTVEKPPVGDFEPPIGRQVQIIDDGPVVHDYRSPPGPEPIKSKSPVLIHEVKAADSQRALNGDTPWTILADRTKSGVKSITGEGHVIVYVAGQDASLTADSFRFDGKTAILTVTGNVRLTRRNVVTTGSEFGFEAASPDYLVTHTNIQLAPPSVVDRSNENQASKENP